MLQASCSEVMMGWHGVPPEFREEWQYIFTASREGLDISTPCPVCGIVALHRWYDVQKREATFIDGVMFRGRGGLWEWCSHCGSYEHAQALVPLWWSSDLVVPAESLTIAPEAIERARKAG